MEYDTIEFASYADNTTPYTYDQNFDEIIEKLEIDMSKICEWFHCNGFNANPGKFYFFLIPFIHRLIEIMGSTIKTSKDEVLLAVRIDSNLTFKERAIRICSKANQKLYVLTRASKHMSLHK